MIMRLSKRMTMVLALLLSVIGADVCAQEVVDSVWVDSVEVDSVAISEDFNRMMILKKTRLGRTVASRLVMSSSP